ncbi:MAG: glycosyl transferase family 1, partial [Myxococcota bacterium]
MRLLFVSEDVTLAQVVRLVVLARTLDPQRHEIHFACRQFSELVFRPGEFIRHTIGTITRAQLEQALARGHRLYDRDTLRGYVAEEIALIEAIEPDLIIGDFRLSLTVSAPACQVPLAALINAYWSPRAELRRFPLPDHPIIGTLGEAVAGLFFPLARPWVFAHFARPINQLRKEHGLAAIGSLREVLTHADYTLYPDVPSLTPIRDLPESQIFLGPVQWAPPVSLPSWWDEWTGSAERPLVYVTMGSSGDVSALSAVMDGLATLPVAVVVATAGRTAGLLDA